MLPITTDSKDWTQYAGRPNPGTGNGGMGVITGYEPVSIYDPLKPADTLDKLVFGDLYFEYENGVGGHKTDSQFFPKEAPEECARVAKDMSRVRDLDDAMRKAAGKKPRPLIFYGCPKFNPNDLAGFIRALRVMSPMFAAADGICVACPREFEMPLFQWVDDLHQQLREIAKVSGGRPLLVQIGLQWAGTSKMNAQGFIPQPDAIVMCRTAKHHKLAHAAVRHEGYRGAVSHLPWWSNLAEAAINRILTGA